MVKRFVDELKKKLLLNVKGFKPDELVAATCLYEGSKASVRRQEREVMAVAARYGGLSGGAENGIKGY